jgi:hypothetical protein
LKDRAASSGSLRAQPVACVLLRPSLSYGRAIFCAGLERLGYRVEHRPLRHPSPRDLLVLWNRRTGQEPIAQLYQQAGARVVICENGYIGHDDKGRGLYAMSLDFHNGAGRWPAGDAARVRQQNIRLEQWRTNTDGFVLVLPQRGIGSKGVAMPNGWLNDTLARLKECTKREVRVRRHPGAVHGPKLEPHEAFEGAHSVVTWGSGAAIKAIAAGLPVFYGMPKWIGGPSAVLTGSREETLLSDERRVAMFERLSGAQAARSEIASGEAFARLLAIA